MPTDLRQSIVIRQKDGAVAVTPGVGYDPVARKVTLSRSSNPQDGWLTAGAHYTLQLLVPQPGDYQNGLRALDGATLDPNDVLAFDVTAAEPAPTPIPTDCMSDADCKDLALPRCTFAALPAGTPGGRQPVGKCTGGTSFCDDVLPIFGAHCSAGQCHGTPSSGSPVMPAAGLALDSVQGVSLTAFGVAHGSNTGPVGGPRSANGRLFELDMPIIDPGHSGTSWLMYKLLLAKPPDASVEESQRIAPECGRCFADTDCPPRVPYCSGANMAMMPPQPGSCQSNPLRTSAPSDMSDAERAILHDHVLGREMPFPSDPGAAPGAATDNPSLTLQQLERVRQWIDEGAQITECVCK